MPAVGFAWIEVFLAWAVSPEVTGALHWLATAIAVIGIPLTYRQSRHAATAAAAAERAVAQFQRRLISANVAHSYAHLGLARGFILTGNYSAAITVIGILKRDVLQTISLLENAKPFPSNLGTARKNLSTIDVQLARASRNDGAFKSNILDRAVQGLGDCLLDWENYLISNTGQQNEIAARFDS